MTISSVLSILTKINTKWLSESIQRLQVPFPLHEHIAAQDVCPGRKLETYEVFVSQTKADIMQGKKEKVATVSVISTALNEKFLRNHKSSFEGNGLLPRG